MSIVLHSLIWIFSLINVYERHSCYGPSEENIANVDERHRDEQDKIAEEKAELDVTFQATVVMEMNKTIQSAGFADLASALTALRNVAAPEGVLQVIRWVHDALIGEV